MRHASAACVYSPFVPPSSFLPHRSHQSCLSRFKRTVIHIQIKEEKVKSSFYKEEEKEVNQYGEDNNSISIEHELTNALFHDRIFRPGHYCRKLIPLEWGNWTSSVIISLRSLVAESSFPVLYS